MDQPIGECLHIYVEISRLLWYLKKQYYIFICVKPCPDTVSSLICLKRVLKSTILIGKESIKMGQ